MKTLVKSFSGMSDLYLRKIDKTENFKLKQGIEKNLFRQLLKEDRFEWAHFTPFDEGIVHLG